MILQALVEGYKRGINVFNFLILTLKLIIFSYF